MAKKKTVPEEIAENAALTENTELTEAPVTAESTEAEAKPAIAPEAQSSDDLPEIGNSPTEDTVPLNTPSPEDLDIPDIVAVELDLPKPDVDVSYDLTPEEVDGEMPAPEDPIPDEFAAEPENAAGLPEEVAPAIEPEAEKAPAPRRTPARRASKAVAPPTPEEDARRSFYQLDFNELDRDLSPEQRQEWNSIYASFRGRSAITGTVVGIDRHAISVRDKATGEMVRQEMYCAIVIPFRVRVVIPESEMWLKGEERPGFVLRNIVGSTLDFVVIHVDREGGFAIGSRRLALRSRRYYFSTRPDMNRVGSRVKCRALAVGPRRCLVCCHGYDIDLTQREMRYTAIPDLRDEYHPGQELDCIVKSFDYEHGKLVISVKETNPNPFDGAELRHPEGSRRQGVIAGKYAGGVFCNLPDGVVIMCSYSFQYDDAAFNVGDKVILVVQRYDFGKKQIYGKIVAKW